MYTKSLLCWKPVSNAPKWASPMPFYSQGLKTGNPQLHSKAIRLSCHGDSQDVSGLDCYLKNCTTSLCASCFLFPNPEVPSGFEHATCSWLWIRFFNPSSSSSSSFLEEFWGLGTPHSLALSLTCPGVPVEDALDPNPHVSAGQGFGIWGQFMFLHPPSNAKSQGLPLCTLSLGKPNFLLHKPQMFWEIYQVLASKSVFFFFLLADCRMWGGLCLMWSG